MVNVNGVQREVPADIGVTCPGGIRALHTHDGSGIIHEELPVHPPTAPTLGDFFAIWGQPLGQSEVWTYSGTVRATVYNADTRSVSDQSASPAAISLYVPRAGPYVDAYPIPPSLIFNGQYGNGQSGGNFDGEIVWLNVTSPGP